MNHCFRASLMGRVALAVATGCLLGVAGTDSMAAAADERPVAKVAVESPPQLAGDKSLNLVLAQPTTTDSHTTVSGTTDVALDVVDYGNAQGPAEALLQGNEAHRKAFLEIVACKNCHGGGTGDAVRWLQVITSRDGQRPQDQQFRAVAMLDLDQAVRKTEEAGPKIGVTVGPLDDVLRAQLGLPAGRGLVVTEVLPESPAKSAGVEAHDVLLNAGGTPVGTEADFSRALREARPGGPPLQLRLVRKGQPVEVSVAPVFPEKKPPAAAGASDSAAGQAKPQYRIGVQIAAADDTLRDQLSLGDAGIVVLEVIPKTPAERQGLRAYDVITKAGGRPVRDERDLREAVQASKEAKLELEYIRAGKREYVSIAPELAPTPPEPRAAANLTLSRPRELMVLPSTVKAADGDHVTLHWNKVNPSPAAGGGGSTAEQLERLNAEIQQLRASIETLQSRIQLEKQEQEQQQKDGKKP